MLGQSHLYGLRHAHWIRPFGFRELWACDPYRSKAAAAPYLSLSPRTPTYQDNLILLLNMRSLLLLISSLLCLATTQAVEPDKNKDCGHWADVGECEKNAAYMLTNCATSCSLIQQKAEDTAAELASITSFFDLSAPTLGGKDLKFETLRGGVTIVANVASQCGYTESHYKSLVELWSEIGGSKNNVNILAFPCNQFGAQEPGSPAEIKAFAKKKGVKFTMMEKVNVNGSDASLVFKYLKHQTKLQNISWNFATYFVVAPDGSITEHTGVEPLELKNFALGLLKEEL